MAEARYPVPQEASLLPVYRAIARCSQQVERLMSRIVEARGLTPSQFDVLATLGDTGGMSFKELSEETLITGGTLTPVLNRMEAKGLAQRCQHGTDKRKVLVKLTPEGQALYEATFLPSIEQARASLEALTPAEQAELTRLLDKLSTALE